MSDPINPSHYRTHPSGVECITITEWFNFNLGNAIKYIWRAGLKTRSKLEDLKKARWYLEREIARVEADEADKGRGTAEIDDMHTHPGNQMREPGPARVAPDYSVCGSCRDMKHEKCSAKRFDHPAARCDCAICDTRGNGQSGSNLTHDKATLEG